MINADMCRRVADRIEREPPELFNMETICTQSHCGTVACIAGHALAESGHTVVTYELGYSDWSGGAGVDEAGFVLGLEPPAWGRLFYGGEYSDAFKVDDPWPQWMQAMDDRDAAIACLRGLADGSVDPATLERVEGS